MRRIAVTVLAALFLAPAAQARPDPTTGAPVSEQPPLSIKASDGFDWADAGIGAATAAGLALVAGAAATVRRQRRVSATT